MSTGRPNRLIAEKSPYLLQHAYNPVDWYPWGEEAFKCAQREDKPIFLSIGYSTCHWCHVMEEESFEDPETARLMNEAFVCIKVDREERPDIDSIYMAACQMMTGAGGWPLTIIMTPDKRPFFTATYIPRETRFGRTGMRELIPAIKALWEGRRDDLLASAEQVTAVLEQASYESPGKDLGESALTMTYEQLSRSFDERHGGFGTAPKFPTPHTLLFLLRYWRRTGTERALQMVGRTLEAMRQGGIYDHIGFGFHRYATDPQWLVPHFEKMLYDQALLAMAYTEAYQATGGNEGYAQTAREIITYVLRDMTGPGGGFYSAEDADSEGEEGKFYLWKEEEISQVLSAQEAELVTTVFNIEKGGNFHGEASRRKAGGHIIYLKRPLSEIASELKISLEMLHNRLGEARRKLFNVRDKRVHPHKDDKILTDWNGLMIAALAKAGQVLEEPRYVEAALRAAGFIMTEMCDEHGRLYHRYRDGEAAVPAFLDDYAFLIWGLLELYEATFEIIHLQRALDLTTVLLTHFWDRETGGFFLTVDDAEVVLVRKKEGYDGAIPSGNSATVLNLLRLARLTGNPDYEAKAAQLIRSFSRMVDAAPTGFTQMMVALDFALGPSYEVVITGNPHAEDTETLLNALRRTFVPNKVVLFLPAGEVSPEITRIAPFTKGMTAEAGRATAYVCQNYRCELPTTESHQMLALLNEHTPYETHPGGGYENR